MEQSKSSWALLATKIQQLVVVERWLTLQPKPKSYTNTKCCIFVANGTLSESGKYTGESLASHLTCHKLSLCLFEATDDSQHSNDGLFEIRLHGTDMKYL